MGYKIWLDFYIYFWMDEINYWKKKYFVGGILMVRMWVAIFSVVFYITAHKNAYE